MKPPKGGAGLEKVFVSYVGGTEEDDEWIPVSKVRASVGVSSCRVIMSCHLVAQLVENRRRKELSEELNEQTRVAAVPLACWLSMPAKCGCDCDVPPAHTPACC